MSESQSKPGSVFELDRIRKLVEMMKEHDLSEVDLCQDEQQIRICRGPQGYVASAPILAASAPAPAAVPNLGSAAPAAKAADGANIVTIKSPMVGTFYASPNP